MKPFAIAFSFVLSTCAYGQIIYVDESATGANDGSDWCDAYNFLPVAIQQAYTEGGDEIRVAQGVYHPDIPGGNRAVSIPLLNGVSLRGGYAGCGAPDPDARDVGLYETTLSGDLNSDDGPDPFQNNSENSHHVVNGSGMDATAVLDGFTITGGNANGTFPDDNGGGAYNDGGSPTLTNCRFLGNFATGNGGGMSNDDNSSPTLTDCTFSGNAAYWGGGMFNVDDSSPTLTRCTFSGNTGSNVAGGMFNSVFCHPTLTDCTFSGNGSKTGGGMFNATFNNEVSSLTVTNCTFDGNYAFLQGGGMYISGPSPLVTNCTFTRNLSNEGGGLYNNKASGPTLTNCRFNGNAAENGGAIFNFGGDSPILVTNCMFSGNSASHFGGGIRHYWFPPGSGAPIVTNSTFTGNTAGIGGGGMFFDGQTGTGPTITNSVLWGNTDKSGMTASAQILVDSLKNVAVVNYSNIQGGWSGGGGTGNIDVDPLFFRDPDPGADGWWGGVDDDYGDLHLHANSPCFDAGNNAAVPPDAADLDGDGDTIEPTSLDLDGILRFLDDPSTIDCPQPGAVCGSQPIVDMGAFETGIPIVGFDKNRYVSFSPVEPGPVAYKLDMVSSLFHPTATVSGWIGVPDANGIASLEVDPVTREWPEPVVHITGCEIAPVAEFELRASADDGATFLTSEPLQTTAQPADKFWGDLVGTFNGIFWPPPNGVVNIDDGFAVIMHFTGAAGAPDLPRTDVHPMEPNRVVNVNDLLFVIFAFQGAPYPFGCPDDPCEDNMFEPCP